MKPSKETSVDSECRFVLEGNALYEIDEECVKRKMRNKKRRDSSKKRK